jgi:hypothetical protein
MPRSFTKKHADHMLDIKDKYLSQGGTSPIDLDDLAVFAINSGLWQKSGAKLRQLCKRELARTFREEYHTDAQGRHVRTFHATKTRDASGKQHVFWADMRSAPAEHMDAAFQQRRNQIVGDCRQLKADVDSWNQSNMVGGYHQLPLDFTEDVAEREQPTNYQPNHPR